MRSKENSKFKIIKLFAFGAISFALIFSLFFNNSINAYFNKINLGYFKNCNLTVHFLDVGQADCTIIQFPNKELMLIDAGAENGNNSTPQYICDYILNNFNKTTIKYVVLTHSDEDHCLSLPLIFDKFKVENIFRPATKATYNQTESVNANEKINVCNNSTYATVINKMKSEENANIVISTAGIGFIEAETSVEFLAPNKNYYLNGESSDALNAISAVIQITYKNKRFLFTGDSNEHNESELLNVCSDIDVLKVAHHGSSTSTTENFLNITMPEYAVISVGAENNYNMPSSNVYARLKNLMPLTNIFRTDQNGTIVFGISAENKILNKTYNFENNKIIWWQVVVVSEILLTLITFIPKKKGFNY